MMKLPPRVADIRTFSKEGRDQLSQTIIQPLEGFTESIEESISEYVSEATDDVDKVVVIFAGFLRIFLRRQRQKRRMQLLTDQMIVE